MNILALLEEIRAIAQLGLNYTSDHFDRERYQRLLRLAATEYTAITGLPEDTLIAQFRQEFGYITPKIGCAAAIFNHEGHILLIKRHDNGLWGLPGGYAEVNQTPQANLQREVREETGLEVEVGSLIDIFCVLPGRFGQPHTLYALLYNCEVTGGTITTSFESPVVGYYDHTTITDWHFDHGERVHIAHQRWLTRQNSTSDGT
jgi:ADP-ribose pyrophosphatase YjhB (NUDIX family)